MFGIREKKERKKKMELRERKLWESDEEYYSQFFEGKDFDEKVRNYYRYTFTIAKEEWENNMRDNIMLSERLYNKQIEGICARRGWYLVIEDAVGDIVLLGCGMEGTTCYDTILYELPKKVFHTLKDRYNNHMFFNTRAEFEECYKLHKEDVWKDPMY